MPVAGPNRNRLRARIATAALIGIVISVIAGLTTGSYWWGGGIALAAGWIFWKSALLGTGKVEGQDTSLKTFMSDTNNSPHIHGSWRG